MIRDGRDHGSHHHPGGHPGFVQLAHGPQPRLGRGGSRLHHPFCLIVEGGDADGHAHQIVFREVGQEIQISQDECALGDDGQRVSCACHHLDNRARHFHVALIGLIGVRVRAQRNRLAHVAGTRELLLQHFSRVGLVEQTRLEIEPGREAHIRVAGTRVAIDATVAASPVRVDRLLEGNVRRVVRGDYAASAIRLEHRGNAVGLFLQVPAVVNRLEVRALKAPAGI